jgi:hypothetical protein
MNVNHREKTWDFTASTTTPTVTSLTRKTKPTPPRVFYTQEVAAMIQYLVEKCTKEVGWLGAVEKIDNDYLIHRIFIPEQTVSGAETDISRDAMAALYMELMDEGFDTGTLIYWGHSHVEMGVSPSNQDETQIGEYLETNPVFIRSIHNKRGAQKVDVFDTEQGFVFQCVSASVHYALNDATKAELDTAIRDKVKDRMSTTSYPGLWDGVYNGRGPVPLHSATRNAPAPAAAHVGKAPANIYTVTGYDPHTDAYTFANGKTFAGEQFTMDETITMDEKLGWDGLNDTAILAGG